MPDGRRHPRGSGAELWLLRVEHGERGNGLRTAIAVKAKRGLERGELELVEPERPGQRVAPAALDRFLGAGDDPRLRSPEELVRGTADEVSSGGHAGPDGGLVVDRVQRARAQVVDHREPFRSSQLAELVE